MGKVKVTQTVEVPEGVLFYDLPSSTFVCKGCGKRKVWDLDARVTRGESQSDKTRIKSFLGAHGQCVAAQASSPKKDLLVPQDLLRGLVDAWRAWQNDKDPVNDSEGEDRFNGKAHAVAEFLDGFAS